VFLVELSHISARGTHTEHRITRPIPGFPDLSRLHLSLPLCVNSLLRRHAQCGSVFLTLPKWPSSSSACCKSTTTRARSSCPTRSAPLRPRGASSTPLGLCTQSVRRKFSLQLSLSLCILLFFFLLQARSHNSFPLHFLLQC
jgi:hypothetical protein